MMITSKGRYALRAMLDLAERPRDGFVRLSDIAARQHISRKYLERIMPDLARHGLLESALGKSGGYRLTRPPGAYRVGEVLRAAEGALAPVACLTADGHKCETAADCCTYPFWEGLEHQIDAYVDSYTLQDLLAGRGACHRCTGSGG